MIMSRRIHWFLPLLALISMACSLPLTAGAVPLNNAASTPAPDLFQTLTVLTPALEKTTPPSVTAVPVQPNTEPTHTATQPSTSNGGTPTRCNWAQFLGDVTIPDGTTLKTGETFVKKWRLKNIGTCTWNADYRLVFNSGSAMSGPDKVSLPKVVAPGDTVDVLVNLKAPSTPDGYIGYWKLATPAGAQFGIGDDAQGSFYVKIDVIRLNTPDPNLIRVNFFANATEGSVADHLAIGETKSYVLNVQSGQLMIVRVTSPTQNALLRIYGYDTGKVLLENSMGAGQSSWQGTVPSTQDYVIEVINRGDPTDFTLGIIIPESINIKFQPGSISASLKYPIHAHETHTFLWSVTKGQKMNLKLTPSDKSVLLAFYGYQDGQPYLRIEAGQTAWTGDVPATQDYIIQVVSVSDTNTDFTLDVSINTY